MNLSFSRNEFIKFLKVQVISFGRGSGVYYLNNSALRFFDEKTFFDELRADDPVFLYITNNGFFNSVKFSVYKENEVINMELIN